MQTTAGEKQATEGFLAQGPARDGRMLVDRDRAAIWWLSLERIGASQWHALAALLSDEERTRAARFHFDRDRRVYTAAHAMCRGLLTWCAGQSPNSWQFTTADHGKPELIATPDIPRLRVNISHTRGLAAVALTVEHDIGIDVEWMERSVEAQKLAQRMFGSSERDAVTAASEDSRIETFLGFWTLKEAYVKAIGKGLSQPLDQFSFDLEKASIRFDNAGIDDPARWRFERYRPGPDHLMALAVRHPDPARLAVDCAAAPLDYLCALLK